MSPVQRRYFRFQINLCSTIPCHGSSSLASKVDFITSYKLFGSTMAYRVSDVLLICPSSHRPAISHYIHSQSSSASFSSVHIDLQTFDESQELSAGTCSVLRHFANRIKEDFILIPCDFIPPPSLPLSKLLNKFRTDTMSDGSIVTSCWYESDKQTTPDEWGSPPQPTPIVWDHLSGTLLYVDSPHEVDKNSDELELRMTLLSR